MAGATPITALFYHYNVISIKRTQHAWMNGCNNSPQQSVFRVKRITRWNDYRLGPTNLTNRLLQVTLLSAILIQQFRNTSHDAKTFSRGASRSLIHLFQLHHTYEYVLPHGLHIIHPPSNKNDMIHTYTRHYTVNALQKITFGILGIGKYIKPPNNDKKYVLSIREAVNGAYPCWPRRRTTKSDPLSIFSADKSRK